MLPPQNCVFNIFKADDLHQALSEVYRVLKPGGRLVMSDPTCEQQMSEELRNNDKLRAFVPEWSNSLKRVYKGHY